MSIEIIAEIGSSHNGSLTRALELIEAAAEAGADTCKFQLFAADWLWRRSDPRNATTASFIVPPSWFPLLIEECDGRNIKLLVTPFHPGAVDQLVNYGVKRFKVASGDLTYTPLLERIAATKFPVLLSCGFSTSAEIEAALNVLKENGVTLMWCVGSYPTAPGAMRLCRLEWLKEFGLPVGLSSHCIQWWADLPAVARGITIVEKHLDLQDRRGAEVGHSLAPDQFARFVIAVRDCEAAERDGALFDDDDLYARQNYRRDPSDWLRPLK